MFNVQSEVHCALRTVTGCPPPGGSVAHGTAHSKKTRLRMIHLQPRLDDCWLRRLYSGTISSALSSPVFLTGHWAQSGESVQQVNETVIDAITLRYCHHRLLETTDFVFIVWSADTQHGSNDVQCGLNINCLADNAHKQV